MEAQGLRVLLVAVALLSVAAGPTPQQRRLTSSHRSKNFVVFARTADVAKQVAMCAERSRVELAELWLGRKLDNWPEPCPIYVFDDRSGAGGKTSFTFTNGHVHSWNMEVQGPIDSILDSVVPHEVNHTVFASFFRRPLPRWFDEGAATLVESRAERLRQQSLVESVLRSNRRIPLNKLLTITEYPEDAESLQTLYAEGYSLADWLVQQEGGRSRFIWFAIDAMKYGWNKALAYHYGLKNVNELESKWAQWVIAGSPDLRKNNGNLYASNDPRANSAGRNSSVRNRDTVGRGPVIRGQSVQSNESPTERADAGNRTNAAHNGEWQDAAAIAAAGDRDGSNRSGRPDGSGRPDDRLVANKDGNAASLRRLKDDEQFNPNEQWTDSNESAEESVAKATRTDATRRDQPGANSREDRVAAADGGQSRDAAPGTARRRRMPESFDAAQDRQLASNDSRGDGFENGRNASRTNSRDNSTETDEAQFADATPAAKANRKASGSDRRNGSDAENLRSADDEDRRVASRSDTRSGDSNRWPLIREVATDAVRRRSTRAAGGMSASQSGTPKLLTGERTQRSEFPDDGRRTVWNREPAR